MKARKRNIKVPRKKRPARRRTDSQIREELKVLRKIEPRPELKERILQAIDKAMISRERYRAFKRTVAVILVSTGIVFILLSLAFLLSQQLICVQ